MANHQCVSVLFSLTSHFDRLPLKDNWDHTETNSGPQIKHCVVQIGAYKIRPLTIVPLSSLVLQIFFFNSKTQN